MVKGRPASALERCEGKNTALGLRSGFGFSGKAQRQGKGQDKVHTICIIREDLNYPRTRVGGRRNLWT